jgi:hypothetical protein
MSRSRALARRNPADLGAGARNVGLAAAGGAALGAGGAAIQSSATWPVWPNGVLGGASTGAGLATVGGVIVGLVSTKYRSEAFATAGVGLAALILAGVTARFVGGAIAGASAG